MDGFLSNTIATLLVPLKDNVTSLCGKTILHIMFMCALNDLSFMKKILNGSI